METRIEVRGRLGEIASGREADRARNRPEPDQHFVGFGPLGAEPHRLARRIVTGQLAGRLDPVRVRSFRRRRAQHGGKRICGHRARPQHGPAIRPQRDDGRFDSRRTGPVIEHQFDPLAQAGDHVRRAGRTDAAAAVGGGCGQRQAACRQQRPDRRVRRTAQRHCRQSGGDRRSNRRASLQRQHQCQRSRPEAGGQRQRARIEHRNPLGGGEVGHVHDQRVEIGAALGPVDRRHRLGPVGPGSEAVDRFGRHRDRRAGAQQRGGTGHAGRVGREHQRATVADHRAAL